MEKKDAAQMGEKKKRSRSLAAKTVRRTVLSGLLLGMVALIIGLAIYGSTMTRQYIIRAFETAKLATSSATRGADSIGLSKDVMGVYNRLTAEQRSLMNTDIEAYRRFFSGLESVSRKGGAHDVLIHMLRNFVNEVDYVYLAMYDQQDSVMVYIADSDPDHPLYPGEWEPVDRREMMKFLNWDGEGMLYTIGKTEKYGWLCTAGYPIRDEAGQICEFLLVNVSVGSVISNLIRYALQISIALAGATLLISWLVARRMKKTVAEPIDAIAGAAMAYVQDRQNGVENGDHFSALGIRTGDELENLSRIMADMEKNLTEHEREITRAAAEKERIGTELHMASLIQSSMLPHVFPPFPDRKEFDLYASMDPAKEVGGDFYDFFLIDKDHLCMVMADVSGKGVPAALFMMVSKVILQSCAMLGRSAGEILTKTNEALCTNNQAQMFVTVWLGILEISTGKLTCANAGHEYPALMRAGGGFELFRDRHGFVIGGMEGVQYREYELRLNPGDKLFVYTDGVPEATNGDQELFGTDRMIAALNDHREEDPQGVLWGIRRAVDGFVRDAEQFDDLTMLCLTYRGRGAE